MIAGRLVIRLAWARPDIFELVHFNDIAAIESVAYLLQYDSVHGAWITRLHTHIHVTIADPGAYVDHRYMDC
jgi:glyceraldehyde 3-phosphate dehydrogenase